MPVPTLTLRTTTPGDTQAIAAAIAASLRPGDAVALSGELGAGKTCFVQGAARELGVTTRVTSPTFTLVRTYAGRVPIVHCDVYRLNRLQDVLDLGDEVLAPDVVTFVEWGDAIIPLLPEDRLDVELLLADPAGPDTAIDADLAPAPGAANIDPGAAIDADPAAVDGDRLIRLTACGTWDARLPEIADACAAWRDGNA